VVVVDDGSTDGTTRIAQEWSAALSLELLRHWTNRGLGETVRDGLRRAVEMAGAEDVIVTMDADDTHSPSLIPEMIGRLRQGHDVVIPSRYRPGAKVLGLGSFRRLMSQGVRLLFALAAPVPGVRDYTCGYRAYRATVLQRAFEVYGGQLITEPGFACMLELLLKLRRLGVTFCEVPMVLRYDRKKGPSKMRVGRTILTTLRLLLRQRARAGKLPFLLVT
jgi:dolichol-phosphate mannosyltransferase